MILKIADWRFRVDVQATKERAIRYCADHCTCGYCKNYYDAVEMTHPELCNFLDNFGIHIHGPCEVMPFEPTYMLVCYRVDGEILQWGETALHGGGIDITPEAEENGTFLLWVGEMELPWVQEEAVEDVISPANLPEFMERMQNMWQLRHGNEFVFS